METTSGLASTLPPLLGLIVLVIIGWFAVVRIRRWMRAESERSQPFTLEDLRRLHREGTLTDEEFARAREAMVGSIRSKVPAKKAKGPGIEPGIAELPSTDLADDDSGSE
ncbi:MAG: hypothetical protein ACKOYN_12290 [Planctomycetota bacterium]